jgi:hypothetical protein
MIPLMQKRTFLTKWFFPYVLVALVLAWQFRGKSVGAEPDYASLVVISAMIIVILFFVIRRQGKLEPDEVLDGGSFLRVRYGPTTDDIPISNLKGVETRKLVRLTRLVLHLRTPSTFGELISFYPLQHKEPSGENAVAAALRRRLEGSAVRGMA